MMAYNAGSADLMAVGQAKMKRNLRACYGRNVAFDESPARIEIEQAAIASVAIRLASSAQKALILHPIV